MREYIIYYCNFNYHSEKQQFMKRITLFIFFYLAFSLVNAQIVDSIIDICDGQVYNYEMIL
jgi:hypothetical protein